MKINEDLVEKLANLARLDFSEEEKLEIKEDLNRITNFFDKLNEVDTSEVEPLFFVTEETNALREDEVKNEVTQKEALKNAPDKNSDFVKVPKVIKN